MKREMEELLRAASYRTTGGGPVSSLVSDGGSRNGTQEAAEVRLPASTPARSSSASALEDRVTPVLRGYSADTNGLAAEIRNLTEATQAATAANVAPPKAAANSTAKDTSTAESVIRTAAMLTGVGPIITGLMGLFGGSKQEELPPLTKFVAPAPVSVEAGLSPTREYGAIRYAQGGRPDLLGNPGSSGSQAATVQVNIQAMDSQSFLDRQDDIARAVREAMLHSNSLNDVVLEL